MGGWGCWTGRGHVAQFSRIEKLAVVTPGRFRPGPHDQLESLFETTARLRRVDVVPEVLGRDAPHEARDQPASGHAVDHGVLLRHPNRVVTKRQNVAEHADLDRTGSLAEGRRNQVGRRHGAIGAVVVLIEEYPFEAELFAMFHLVEVFFIVASALGRVEQIAGQGRARDVHGHVRIGEKVKVVYLHRSPFQRGGRFGYA